jgi:hypothetical protein
VALAGQAGGEVEREVTARIAGQPSHPIDAELVPDDSREERSKGG